MDIYEFHKGMQKHFGILQPGEYLDPLYLKMQTVKIDLIKFDRWLGDNTSMGSKIESAFGLEAREFIAKLL